MRVELLEDIVNFMLYQASIRKNKDGSYSLSTGRLTITVWGGYISYFDSLTRHLCIKRLPRNTWLLLMELLELLC